MSCCGQPVTMSTLPGLGNPPLRIDHPCEGRGLPGAMMGGLDSCLRRNGGGAEFFPKTTRLSGYQLSGGYLGCYTRDNAAFRAGAVGFCFRRVSSKSRKDCTFRHSRENGNLKQYDQDSAGLLLEALDSCFRRNDKWRAFSDTTRGVMQRSPQGGRSSASRRLSYAKVSFRRNDISAHSSYSPLRRTFRNLRRNFLCCHSEQSEESKAFHNQHSVFLDRGFGFLTSLRSVRNDSGRAPADGR